MASIVNDLLACGAKLLITNWHFPYNNSQNYHGDNMHLLFSEFTLLSFPIFFAIPNNISK